MKISDLQASNPGLYNTDKFSDHSYGPFYDELFRGKETAELNILEIGVYMGGSVRLWHDYLTKSNIYGTDINPIDDSIREGYSDRLRISSGNAYPGIEFKGSRCSIHFSKLGDFYGFDVIIDDGPHTIESQIYTLEHFPALLKPGGILIIEDVPEGVEMELIKHAPSGGKFWIENLRHVKGRWDDCLVVFKKD